jgi:transcription antitermination factor NusG
MTKWFVATTKHMQESLAAAQLREQGYIVYLPKTYSQSPNCRRPIAEVRYPGYIFIRFDAAAQEHGPINNTRGVDELMVDLDGNPRPLPTHKRLLEEFPKGLVEAIRELEDIEFGRASTTRKAKPREDLQEGDKVRIHNPTHPAHGHEGHILKLEKGIASVLVGFFNVWKLPDTDLKRIDTEKRKAA